MLKYKVSRQIAAKKEAANEKNQFQFIYYQSKLSE